MTAIIQMPRLKPGHAGRGGCPPQACDWMFLPETTAGRHALAGGLFPGGAS